jgi:ATP-dependent protease HslVU (ClpYQ) peptidase subunit
MNALVSVRFTVDVPEPVLERLVGRADDESDEWYRAACEAAEEWVRDDLLRALEHAGEPDVDCDS